MAAQPAVNTKKAAHREQTFNSLDDLQAELDRIREAHERGALRTTGNWSIGQILQHLATAWKMGLDGVDFKAPLLLRAVCMPLRNRLAHKPTPRGIRLRGKSKSLEPQAEVAFENGWADLERTLARVRHGERLDKPSALFGRMSHEQWMAMDLNHSAMHLGFVAYDGE